MFRVMSVAFTREEDLEATAADLADRPISPHPNLVTPQGLAMIEAELAAAAARVNVATANLFPQISLGGSYGSTALDSGELGDDQN
ncbi:TolC family protein, partial [Lactiplantibacillus plantarum]|nr:TolC family protein [Lactiplantibacillus plantarum]